MKQEDGEVGGENVRRGERLRTFLLCKKKKEKELIIKERRGGGKECQNEDRNCERGEGGRGDQMKKRVSRSSRGS